MLLLFLMTMLHLLVKTQSVNHYKVGVLMHYNTSYTPAIKKIVKLAIADLTEDNTSPVSLSLVIKEYGAGMLNSTITVCDLIASGVVAVVSFGDSSKTAIEAELFSHFNIPVISVAATNPYLKFGNTEYLLLLPPSDKYQAEAIFHMLQHFSWVEFSVLASADDYGIHSMMDLVFLQHIITRNNNFVIKNIQYFNVEKNSLYLDIRNKLQIISDSLSKIVILNCSPQYGKIVFKIAHEMGLMGPGFVWIVTDAIAGQPEALSYNGKYPSYYEGLVGTLPSLHKGSVYKKFKDHFTIDKNGHLEELTVYTLMSYDAIGIVHKALTEITESGRKLNVPSMKCTSKDKTWSEGSTMFKVLTSVSLSGVSGKCVFENDGSSARTSYDFVNFVESGFVRIGTWSNSSGIQIEENIRFLGGQKELPSAFTNTLTGRHLRIGIVEEPPLAFKRIAVNCTNNYSSPDCWTGYSVDLNKRLAEELNYTFEFVESADNKYGGYQPEDGTWNGMIGDLLANKIDIVGTVLSINVERGSMIGFTFPFGEDVSASIIKGVTATQNTFFFLTPFRPLVWGMIVAIIVLFTVLINLLNKLSPYGQYGRKMHAMQTCKCDTCDSRRKKEGDCSLQNKLFNCRVEQAEDEDTLNNISLYNSAWLVSTGFVGHCADHLPKCPSGRFLMLSWWFFVMIMISLYTANLTAYLTFKRVGIPIDNIKDLLKQKDLKWGVITDRITEARLLNHVDDTYAKIVMDGDTISNLTEAIQRVKQGNFVFIDERSVLDYNFRDDCDLVKFVNEIQSSEWAFGLHKYSPYISVINKVLLRLREEEYFTRLKKTWYEGDSTCDGQSVGSDSPFELATLAGLFYTLAIAILVCVVLLFCEYIYAASRDFRKSPDKSLYQHLKTRLCYKVCDICREWMGRCKGGEQNLGALTKVNNINDNILFDLS